MVDTEPDEEMAESEAAAPAVEGPLPFNYVANEAEDGVESWTLMGYSHTAVAADWRTPTEKMQTVFKRPAPDHLFSAGQLDRMAKAPDALLNPPPLQKEEKKAIKQANKAEAERRSDLSDVDREWEDEQTRAEKWLKERQLNRRRLTVRMGRKAWN